MIKPTLKRADFFISLIENEKRHKLFGPSMVQILKLNGKLITLFGDHHRKVEDIPEWSFNISEFIEFLIQYIPACFDIFLESGEALVQGTEDIDVYKMANKSKYDLNYGLPKVVGDYWESLGNYKKPDPTNFNRIHNINIRKQLDSKYNLQYLPVTSDYDIYNYLYIGLLNGEAKLIAYCLNYLFETDTYTEEKIINESNLLKISKQYKDIPYGNELKSVILDDLHKNELAFDKNLLTKFKGMMSVRLARKIVDIYALPRILKTIYVYDDSDIIIVYAGAAHTVYYAQKLVQYGAEVLYETNNEDGMYINYKNLGMTEYEISEMQNVDGNFRYPAKNHIILDENMVDVLIDELWHIAEKQNKCSFKSKQRFE